MEKINLKAFDQMIEKLQNDSKNRLHRRNRCKNS